MPQKFDISNTFYNIAKISGKIFFHNVNLIMQYWGIIKANECNSTPRYNAVFPNFSFRVVRSNELLLVPGQQFFLPPIRGNNTTRYKSSRKCNSQIFLVYINSSLYTLRLSFHDFKINADFHFHIKFSIHFTNRSEKGGNLDHDVL